MLSVLIAKRENPNIRERVTCEVMTWDEVRDWVLDNYRGWMLVNSVPAGEFTSDYCSR